MKDQTRRHFLKSAAAVTAAASLPFACSTPAPQKPNIIYILADDLGYADLGCYGQKEIQTPNLDRMAAQGMRFTDHYSGSTVCAPSRCCVMTGKHTGHARIRGNGGGPLQPRDVTVAEQLQAVGYKTAVIGKWGLGHAETTGVPNRQGFDYFYGYLDQVKAHNFWPEYLWRNEQKVELDNTVKVADRGYAKGRGGASSEMNEYSHDLFTEEAISFVEQQQIPFFLYLAYTIPHANNENWVLDRHGMEVPGFDYGIYNDKDWPDPQKGHAAMITRMDRDIGQLMEKLQELGIAENTLVMFSSDNGPHREGGNDPDFNDSNGPLRGIKRDLYEGGIRVPFIAWWPGTVPAGAESAHISAFWDLLPTASQLAGAPVTFETDGISMAPTLLGKPEEQPEHEYLYWEFHEGRGSKQAVRKGKWKAVRLAPNQPVELYDLSRDIGETNNIAAEHPDIVETLTAIIEQARTPDEQWPLRMAE